MSLKVRTRNMYLSKQEVDGQPRISREARYLRGKREGKIGSEDGVGKEAVVVVRG
ncbi:hypothetical protein LOAG_02769 [Loa loa]|uniref:Uncharacterized protein n=1 Tax=Loa loa TaxID=7209 RepID=A0A1S0U7W1_LOALO|nr:hypothetical protein LOAG_02769 [Loa loa]EFO25713.2 hypothetical protein LOAG_02769 [Loa loa]